jgi:hypothetical protein
MSKSAKPYLRHILDEIAFLQAKARTIDKQEFFEDKKPAIGSKK